MVGDYMTVITATPGTGAAEEEPAPASIADHRVELRCVPWSTTTVHPSV